VAAQIKFFGPVGKNVLKGNKFPFLLNPSPPISVPNLWDPRKIPSETPNPFPKTVKVGKLS